MWGTKETETGEDIKKEKTQTREKKRGEHALFSEWGATHCVKGENAILTVTFYLLLFEHTHFFFPFTAEGPK